MTIYVILASASWVRENGLAEKQTCRVILAKWFCYTVCIHEYVTTNAIVMYQFENVERKKEIKIKLNRIIYINYIQTYINCFNLMWKKQTWWFFLCAELFNNSIYLVGWWQPYYEPINERLLH